MRPCLWLAAAAIGLLPAGSAWTQTAAAPSAKVDAAHAAWRKLSQSEVNCVDKALRARNSQIWQLIQRGVGPTDTLVAAVRAGCRPQAQTQAHAPPTTSAAPARAAQAPAAQGAGREYWSFNGSTLKMVADGSLRKFFYVQPDPEAEAVGAQRGDLFLEGKVTDQRFVGTVYGFEGRCGRIPYRVDGAIRDNSRRLDLQGQKPRVDGTCTVVGTVLDALTFRSVDAATAVAAMSAARTNVAKPEAAKPEVARPEVARPEVAKSDVGKPDVAKPDVGKPEVGKPAVARPAIEKAASVMASADRAAVERAEAEDAAEFRIAPDKTPADRPAASRATSVKVVIAAASESKAGGNEAVAEKASAETVVEIARAEAARVQAEAERARNEAERAVAEAIATVASAQSKIGFLYGLISGPVLIGVGAVVFLLVRRRKQTLPEPSAT
ncbi:MAG: hypothetical protein K2Y27_34435 [Xanthobacteraceae bacterium]|nr:hypothetical protein [Xanthobacteraceae bacterium]